MTAFEPPIQRNVRASETFAGLWIASIGLFACMAVIAAAAPLFSPVSPWETRLVVAFSVTLSMAGIFFLIVCALLRRATDSAGVWIGALLLGVALRAIMIPAPPILEDDWRRYVWEGAVVAAGLSPYEIPPAAGLDPASIPPLPPTVAASGMNAFEDERLMRARATGAEHPDYPERVNNPYLTSIYPLTAQGAFMLAHWLKPFDLSAWRFILGAADLATFLLLIRTLAAYGRSRRLSLLYWLNPLVVFETYQAAHMDALLGPFILAALLFARQTKPGFAGLALAGAAGVKLWPILLVPMFARRFMRKPAMLLVFAGAFGLAATILLAPMLAQSGDPSSGLAAYAADWRTNAFMFPMIESAQIGRAHV